MGMSISSLPSSRNESTTIATKLLVIEQMRKAVSASGADPLEIAQAAAARVHELAVDGHAVRDARSAQLADRLGEVRVDGERRRARAPHDLNR